MFKKIILILALICMIVLPVFGQTGTYTTHNLFYLPKYGAYGLTEYNTYNEYMEIADAQIWANKDAGGGASELSDLTDVGVTTPTDKYVLVADGDSFESRALVEADVSDLGTYIENLLEDETPELYAALDYNNKSATEVATIQFNELHAIGNSGATKDVSFLDGQYQSITISENTTISFTNEFVGTITLIMTYTGGDYTVALGDTILEEGGTEIVFSETNGLVDILKVMNIGVADTFIVGALIDVKD